MALWQLSTEHDKETHTFVKKSVHIKWSIQNLTDSKGDMTSW